MDQAKDQVMTALKLALANLVMWARDTYFPATYARHLAPPGAVLPLAWADRVGKRHGGGGIVSLQ